MTRLGYGGRILDLKPRRPNGGREKEDIQLIKKRKIQMPQFY